MKSRVPENDPFWDKDGSAFNLDEDEKKYNFNEVNKYSVRSSKQVPAAAPTSNLKTYQNVEHLSYSLNADSDLQCPELLCNACGKIIVDHDSCKYESNKVFTNEICWQHWIDKMVEGGDIMINQLCSMAAKQYCLERVCATCNGQLILKVTLALKGAMQPFEFGSLMYMNPMACNHYLSFLKETRQSDDKLLRCNNQIEEAMCKLRELFQDNANVGETTVLQFMRMLSEFRDERLLSLNIPLQCEMIKEYICLLDWQNTNNKSFINAPLNETLISNQVSFKAIRDNTKAKYLKDTYKLSDEEFVWTCIKPIVDENKANEIDGAFNHKVMGSRPDISWPRIVAYEVLLNKEPDEVKMKSLSKISDISELVECAEKWKLLTAYIEYCKQNKDSKQVKNIQQYQQNRYR